MIKARRTKSHVITVELTRDSEPHARLEFVVPVVRASSLLAPLMSDPPQAQKFCTTAVGEFLRRWENVEDDQGNEVECNPLNFYQYMPLDYQLETYLLLISKLNEMCGFRPVEDEPAEEPDIG